MEVLLLLPRDDRQLWILPLWHILPTGNFHFNEKLSSLYGASSQLLTSMKNLNTWPTSWKPKRWSRCCHHSSQHLNHILTDKDQKMSSKLVTSRPFPQRCRWVRTFWPMDVPKMGSISSEQTEKNLVLTTPTMISGLRFESLISGSFSSFGIYQAQNKNWYIIYCI